MELLPLLVVFASVALLLYLRPHSQEPVLLHVKGSRMLEVVRNIGADHGFRPAWWLSSGHLQTIFFGMGLSKPRRSPSPVTEERWTTPDGGTLRLVWPFYEGKQTTTVCLIIPGLNAGTSGATSQVPSSVAATHGMRPVIFPARGSIPLTSAAWNFFGSTDDLREAVRHIKLRYPSAALAIVASSAGTALAVRYLGEEVRSRGTNPLRPLCETAVFWPPSVTLLTSLSQSCRGERRQSSRPP